MRRLAIKVRDLEDVRVALEEILHTYDLKLDKSVQDVLDEGINYVIQGFNFNYMTKETSEIKECFIVDLSDKEWQIKLYKHRAMEEEIRKHGAINLMQNFVEKHGLEVVKKLKERKSFKEFLDEREKQEEAKMKKSHFVKAKLINGDENILNRIYEIKDESFDKTFEQIKECVKIYDGQFEEDVKECIDEAYSNQEDVCVNFGTFKFSIDWFDAEYGTKDGILNFIIN